jgi:hypothetical protein
MFTGGGPCEDLDHRGPSEKGRVKVCGYSSKGVVYSKGNTLGPLEQYRLTSVQSGHWELAHGVHTVT